MMPEPGQLPYMTPEPVSYKDGGLPWTPCNRPCPIPRAAATSGPGSLYSVPHRGGRGRTRGNLLRLSQLPLPKGPSWLSLPEVFNSQIVISVKKDSHTSDQNNNRLHSLARCLLVPTGPATWSLRQEAMD